MIVDTSKQLETLVEDIKGREIVVVALHEDEYLHPIFNSIIGYYVKVFGGGEYTLLQNHPEMVLNIDPLPVLEHASKIYLIHKHAFLYNRIDLRTKVVDGVLQTYLKTGQVPDQSVFKAAEFYSRRVPVKTNLFVDAIKLQEYGRSLASKVVQTNNVCEDFYTSGFLKVFHAIEQNGLKVDPIKFKTSFPDYPLIGDTVYTKYNFYTATGRPSNRFGGVNFAALNKEDSTRECFISRYDGGILVEIDFQSYHPRILADLIGYQVDPSENIYEHLAKFYFDTDKPTKEQITESKELTFKQMYGGISSKYKNIEYFSKIQNFTDLVWEYYKANGCIQSKVSKRDISNVEDASPTKLLNYLIQLHETEQNVVFLHALFGKLNPDIKPILYTYDSVLFDLPSNLVEDLESTLKSIIPTEFPYRLKKGLNYKDLA